MRRPACTAQGEVRNRSGQHRGGQPLFIPVAPRLEGPLPAANPASIVDQLPIGAIAALPNQVDAAEFQLRLGFWHFRYTDAIHEIDRLRAFLRCDPYNYGPM